MDNVACPSEHSGLRGVTYAAEYRQSELGGSGEGSLVRGWRAVIWAIGLAYLPGSGIVTVSQLLGLY